MSARSQLTDLRALVQAGMTPPPIDLLAEIDGILDQMPEDAPEEVTSDVPLEPVANPLLPIKTVPLGVTPSPATSTD